MTTTAAIVGESVGDGEDASVHLCASDGRLTYLPALDPNARDWPGGAIAAEPIRVESIPDFDFDPRQDGSCWVCAYADALRRGRVEPPRRPEVGDRDYALTCARARLRALHVVAAARRTLAEVEPERRAAADRTAPYYREATPEEVREVREEEGLAVRLAGVVQRALDAVSLGATPAEAVAVAAQNAPLKDDVLEVPPDAVDSVSAAKKGRRRRKKFDGGPGQQSMF